MNLAVAAPWAADGRSGRFELSFHRSGERTRLGRQFVSYPFHLTRPFTLDPALPALTTVYQQSCSGGLYRGDRLQLRIGIGPAAAVHFTTQAATVVHDCRGRAVEQTTHLRLEPKSFLAWTPDPLVLMPGAAVTSRTEVTLGEGAVALLSDAFARHPLGGRPPGPERLDSDLVVRDRGGVLGCRERWSFAADDLARSDSPLGGFPIAAAHLLLGPAHRLPPRVALKTALHTTVVGGAAVAGVSALPNGLGWSVRVLAQDAVAERAIATALFVLATRTALGAAPRRRPK